ncbi:hypothetical protein GCM10010289_68530 [Streptomyces violascens]|nr:hypothetical protein GCM10010289_68530 [Streptomyces violascens]
MAIRSFQATVLMVRLALRTASSPGPVNFCAALHPPRFQRDPEFYCTRKRSGTLPDMEGIPLTDG